jgi:Flp pilus assembly protein TadG
VSNRRPAFVADDRGATAVEAALCLPIMIVLIFGIFQFGLVQHTRSSLRFTLDQAARTVVIDPDTTEAQVQAFVTSKFESLANDAVTVTLTKTDTANGRVARLSAQYLSVFEVPGLGAFSIPHSVTVTRSIRST